MKNYLVSFSGLTGIPGLSPTFILFKNVDGTDVSNKPGITQIPTNSGLYYFSYGPTAPIAFTIDGATSFLGGNRYVTDMLDPLQAVDELGSTLIAGVSLLMTSVGNTTSSFGSTTVDPGTMYGYLRRIQEFLEGNSVFSKTNGTWDIYSRGSGTTTQLIRKTLVDTSTSVTKS